VWSSAKKLWPSSWKKPGRVTGGSTFGTLRKHTRIGVSGRTVYPKRLGRSLSGRGLKKLLTPDTPTKKDEIDRQRKLVEEAMARFPSDVNEQIRFTGMKKSTFYNRRRELLHAG